MTPIPAGWKPLPATMTLDMSVAFAEAWYSKHRAIDDDDMQDAYAAMLAAAPTPPATTQDEPITVAIDPDPRGVSVGVWQGSSCIYTGAHALPAPAAGDALDAARYRWLRDIERFAACEEDGAIYTRRVQITSGVMTASEVLTEEDLDAAIDAAQAPQQGEA